jgi:hypothetical protein
MVEQANGAGRGPPKRLFWRLMAFAPARAAIAGVCRYMSWRVERQRGPPAADSARGVVRLWRIEQFRQMSLVPDEPWPRADGVVLRADDPVLDFHIAGDKLLAQLSAGRRWRTTSMRNFVR